MPILRPEARKGHGLREPYRIEVVGYTIATRRAAEITGLVAILGLRLLLALLVLHLLPQKIRHRAVGQVVEPDAGALGGLLDCCRGDSSITLQLCLRPREDRSAEAWGINRGCSSPTASK